MNDETGLPGRSLMPKLSSAKSPATARVEHVVFTRANPRVAWKVFSDWKLWPSFSDIYRSIEWQGVPWETGSRLRIEIHKPLQATVDRVITVCMPPHCVAWINHVRGYTMEHWVRFDPYHGGGTRVSTWVEVTGAELQEKACKTPELIKGLMVNWFENFVDECDRVVDGAGTVDFTPPAD
jgi:hypothetical protein